MRRLLLLVVAGLVVLLGAGAVVVLSSAPAHTPAAPPEPPSSSPASTPAAPALPLAGVTIALDPGHQLGNARHPEQVNRVVDAGGLRKACNTTGTETAAGLPEATINFRVARAVERRLAALGATVRLTRTRNSLARWGPCVDVRGRFGGRVGADLMLSIHADGAGPRQRGFHLIVPARSARTAGISGSSLRLARSVRAALDAAGARRSDYVGGGTALRVRRDLGTLNLSSVPVVMVELGNLRNAADARLLSGRPGQERYAAALVRGIRGFLRR